MITNDGDIFAGTSRDGGKTVLWGDAINASDAPGPVLIQLFDAAPSHIFGNILTPGNSNGAIVVDRGPTFLSGQVNPGGPLQGTLDIRTSGKLVFENHDPANGASGAWLQTFTMHVGSTLGIELTANDDPTISPTFKLHYPRIFTQNVANLRGKLSAVPARHL